jgi:hypothetical protein
MGRVLLAIGCREYDNARGLRGADADAENVFRTLVEETGHYDPSTSRCLLSPTLADVRSALDSLFDLDDVDVISFFFAGHGAVDRGTCHLCPKDAVFGRLPTTALRIDELLSALAGAQPRQINIVMDSCYAGGAMFDMANLLKPENLVGPESSNVSFFAASARDQSAYGNSSGGRATTALMRYLNGDEELRSDRPFLDLVELGRRISDDVSSGRQRPVAWGINLFGEDEFAENPFYEEPAAGRPPPLVTLAPNTAAGTKVREYSEALWLHYQRLPSDPDYGNLAELLRAACEELEEEGASSVAFLRGVATSLRYRAETAEDLFAPSDVLACCAMALLPLTDEEAPAALVRELLEEKRGVDAALREELIDRLRSDTFALLNKAVVLADYFLLPIRVSRTLGWLASGELTDELLDISDDEATSSRIECARLIIGSYRGSLVAMSDSQAAQVYLFAKACEVFDEADLASEVLTAHFGSLESVGGFVAPIDIEPSEALRYLVGRMAGVSGANHKIVANPVQFLPALLLPGARLGLGTDWDCRLRAFDGKFMGVFVPENHRDFGMSEIPTGTNYHPRMGHDIWRTRELSGWFEETVDPIVSGDASLRSVETKSLCVIVSYLFSDRLPLFL